MEQSLTMRMGPPIGCGTIARMGEEKRRSLWFYLVGCTPTTFVLLGILFVLVMGPALLNVVSTRLHPPEPRRFDLPVDRTGDPWLFASDSWHWSTDLDGDGRPECLRQPVTRGPQFVVPGKRKECLRLLTMRLFSGRPRELNEELRDALAAVNTFKLEQGWIPVSVVDTDADGRPDCVLDQQGRGVVLRRKGATCPGDEYSLPEPLETHPRLADLERLFELESAVRNAMGHDGG